jgi:tripartite-type tricarboxylate transporter receptor subunit TctC
MRDHFRTALAAAVIFLLSCSLTATAAEPYPSKPARLILPFGAGASTDIIGRIFAQRFSEAWGQTLVIDNRPGAGGVLGTELAAKAAPDGYTIFTYGINQTITPHLYKKLPYDPMRDFVPLSLYATMPNILCVNLSLPATTVSEFIKLAKANPGKFKYASSGIGASPHLTMALFGSITGIDMVHVPYKVASQGYTDTISGEIQAFFFNLPGPLPFVKAGRLRALAVTSAKRAEQVPNVPTLIESGIADFEVTVWQGYAVPKGTARAHMASIHAAMMKALALPDLKQRFFENGVSAAPQTPDEFVKFIQADYARWGKAVAVSGAKIE